MYVFIRVDGLDTRAQRSAMRLLHISDLHIGKQVNEFPMLDDQRFMLERILDIIRTRKIDALLIAGDIYDRSAPSADAVACVDWFLSAVAKTGAACIAIPGNHDSAERVAYASDLLAKNGIHLSPAYNGEIAHVALEDEHGPVMFWLFPFLKPALVRPFFPDEEIVTYTDALRLVADSCPLDSSMRNVALTHQFITYGGTQPDRTDSELSLGGVDNVDVSVFNAFDYVAIGHVHRPQRIGRDTARYSGSILKYSASEIDYPKSAPLITLGAKGSVDIELIPLEPLHDMRQVRGPLAELVSDETTADLSQSDREDYLHVVLTDAFPPVDALSTLRSVYKNVMSISYDNARSESNAAHDAEEETDLEQLSPIELFARFYETQNGKPLTQAQSKLAADALENNEEDR